MNSDTPAGELITASTPAGFSRRSMLGALGIGSLGLLTAPNLLGCTTKAAAATPATKAPKHPKPRRPKPKKQLVLDDNGNFVQPGPYYLQASCEMSQDFFLTDEVVVDPSASDLLPFYNPTTKQTEAIVITGSTVSHLRRDPTFVTGWRFETIDQPFGDIEGSALASGNKGPQLVLTSFDPIYQNPVAVVLTLTDATNWSVSDTGYPGMVTLKAGVTAAGDVYFYGWGEPDDNKNTRSYDFYGYDDQLNETPCGTGSWSTSYTLEDALLLLDATGPDGKSADYAAVIINGSGEQQIGVYSIQNGKFGDSAGNSLYSAGASNLLTMSYTAANTSGKPAVAFQLSNGDVWFLDETGTEVHLNGTGSGGAGQVAWWKLNGAYTFAMLANDTLTVQTQFGSGANSGFTAPIPMLDGVGDVYSVPGDSSMATLFALDADTNVLSVLTKDADGWTQNIVHQDGAKQLEVTSWRVQITGYDVNGTGLSGATVRLTPDRPVGFWLEGTGNGSGGSSMFADTNNPVTVTANAVGKVTLAIPTSELDVAQLTAQILDANGNPSGNPFTIVPNTDVHNFMAGNTTLNGYGKLDGPALQNAQKQTWDPQTNTFVNSGSLVNVGNSDGASAAVGAFHHLAQAGLNQNQSGVQSAMLDCTGSTPTFTTSGTPNAFQPDASVDTTWWASAQNDAGTVHHAIRHGSISLKKMFTSWADDLKQWVVKLVVHLEDEVDHLMEMAISDVKSAIHAISGFFQAIGAALKDAWNWLKHTILDVLHNTGKNSAVLEGWLGQLSSEMQTIMQTVKTQSTGFFSGLKGDANTKLQTMQQQVDNALFGPNSGPPPQPTNDSSSNGSGLNMSAIGDFQKFVGYASGSWLMHKIEAHLPGFAPEQLKLDVSVFQDSFNDLASDAAQAEQTVIAMVNLFVAAIKTAAESPTKLTETQVATLFNALEAVVDDACDLLEQLANTFFDMVNDVLTGLNDLFTSEFPLPGLLVDLLELAGINPDFTIEHVVCLVVSFPATLAAQLIRGDSTLFPATSASDTRVGSTDTADLNGFGMNLAASIIQAIWALDDLGLDIVAFTDEDDANKNSTVSSIMTVIDFTCPALLTILQWPVPVNVKGSQTPPPFKYNDFSDSDEFGNDCGMLPWIVFSTFAPWVAEGCGWAAGLIWGTPSQPSPAVSNYTDYAVPVIQTLAGLASEILGCWYGYQNAKTDADKALAIIAPTISNLSYIDACLGIPAVIKATEDVTAFIKLVIDTFGNFGTVFVLWGEAFSAL